MSERTCGNCAWWEDCGKVFEERGVWVKRGIDGKTFRWYGNAKCMHDPVTVQKYPDEFCRHHATTRVWAADANEPRQSIRLIVDDTTLEDLMVAETERLKARSVDRHEKIKALQSELEGTRALADMRAREVERLKERCLEASDDA